MIRPLQVAPTVCLVLLLAVAGCLSVTPPSSGPTATTSPAPVKPEDGQTTAPGYREAPNTPEPLAGRANCSEDLWVASWGLNDPRLWDAHEVRYGTYVPPNASLNYVAYVDGAVRGSTHASTIGEDGGINVDGGSIEIAEDLAGEHAVRIVVHQDVDHDGAFDPETDAPCYNDDGLVQTAHLVIDFDRYW